MSFIWQHSALSFKVFMTVSKHTVTLSRTLQTQWSGLELVFAQPNYLYENGKRLLMVFHTTLITLKTVEEQL